MEEVQQPCEDSVYSPLTLPCICHGDWLITLLFPLLFRKRKGGAHDCEGDTNSLPGTVAAVNRSTWQFSHVKKGQLLNEHSLGRFLMSLLIGLLIRSFFHSPLILELRRNKAVYLCVHFSPVPSSVCPCLCHIQAYSQTHSHYGDSLFPSKDIPHT